MQITGYWCYLVTAIIVLIFSNTAFQHRSDQPQIKQNLVSSIKELSEAVATRVAKYNKEILKTN